MDIHGLPFKRLPKLLITELVWQVIILLNFFPAPDSVSKTLSPKTIMTGKPNLNYNKCKIAFGSYALVFEDNDLTNTTKLCTTRAIALNPTGNSEGDYHFMLLTTGKHLARQQWTAVPMPDAVIAAVEARALEEKQPLIEGGCPFFEWHPNVPLHDEESLAPPPPPPSHQQTQPDALGMLADVA